MHDSTVRVLYVSHSNLLSRLSDRIDRVMDDAFEEMGDVIGTNHLFIRAMRIIVPMILYPYLGSI
jgi:hypothetical protein